LAFQGATLVGAGAAGAVVTVGIVAPPGALGGATTTVREVVDQSPLPDAPSFAREGRALTMHDVYMRAAPGVVQVTARRQALGSGFVIDKAGHIVTNLGVVHGAAQSAAASLEVSFSSNERLPARIVGLDPSTDLAVLQVKARSRALMPLALGNSDHVRVGDGVIAIGNPRGDGRAITAGIVSALERWIAAPNGVPIDHVIKTDAALDRSYSGGPLLSPSGQVIGLSSRIPTANGSAFAIPINTVKNVAAQLIAKGVVEHASVGLEVHTLSPKVAALYRLPVRSGLLVGKVCHDGAAAKAGVRGATQHVTLAGDTWPLGGDIIVRIDGDRVTSAAQLREFVGSSKPGDSVELELYRGNKITNLSVKLGRQPASPRC
jgi:S1-C subfamily serine protease